VHDLPRRTPSIGIPDSKVEPSDLEHILEHPFWSADGRSIYAPSYVLYQALTGFSIWERADAQNGGSTFVGELPEVMDATPSPDRKAVLFTSSSARGDIWFVARAIDGDDAAWHWAETPNGMLSSTPAWAPDGQAVAYYRCELEQPERCSLHVLTPTGDALMVGAVAGGVPMDRPATLDWSRDG
jgi:Tol biopolymer transport system component